MCGICGKLYFDRTRPVDQAELKAMTDTIIHRGPDDEGYYVEGGVGLGFRRLSIIDLRTGHQPIANEDESVWIIFNGEIYNFQHLRAQLIGKGHRFSTTTDTETIVHLYEEYGEECVRHLRGMFAFAIWDSRRQQLFCARDRFGIKPLYYYVDDHQFVFGSELKAIMRANGVRRDLNPAAIDSYFSYGYVLGDQSIYRDVKKLEPAHTVTVRRGGSEPVSVRRYWDVVYDPDFSRTEQEWMEEIESVLSESVKLHMISDVALGAFLSGGIDSSSVVALMTRHSTEPVKTFSIGFPESNFNELEFARAVAKRYGTDHHEQIVEPQSIDLLPTLVRAYDQPYADSSAIPTYHVSRLAREHVTVALSGDGGDELFAGYRYYPKFRDIRRYNRLPGFMRRSVWGAAHALLPQKVKGKGITYFLTKDPDVTHAHLVLWNQHERAALFSADLWDAVKATPAEAHHEGIMRRSTAAEFVSRMQELDLRAYLPDDILTKVDIASMQHSLEVRVPILDHVFAELTFRIPAGWKLHGRTTKHIFREAMRPHLPANVLGHRKQGFAVPMESWFKKDLRAYVEARLGSSNSAIAAYVDRKYMMDIVRMHNTGMRDFSLKIWSLLFFAEWLEQRTV
jgi:asparagine synthase (glutamine-hydrolysing)